MAVQTYEWTLTADGHEVMGGIRIAGATFTNEDFTSSQIRHLVGMSFAKPVKSPETKPTPPQPIVNLGALGSEDEIIERLLEIYETSGWTAIKALAYNYGITEKPSGGWDEAIPMIAAIEANGGDN